MSYNFLPESLEIIENPYENGVAGFSRTGGAGSATRLHAGLSPHEALVIRVSSTILFSIYMKIQILQLVYYRIRQKQF